MKLPSFRLHSFRLRVALLSALLAGGAIAGFSFLSFLLFYQAKLSSLDNEIKDQLLREASAPRPTSHWESYARSRSSFFGEDTQPAIALIAIDPEGKTLYKSDSWSSEFDRTALFPQQTSLKNDLQFPSASLMFAGNRTMVYQSVAWNSDLEPIAQLPPPPPDREAQSRQTRPTQPLPPPDRLPPPQFRPPSPQPSGQILPQPSPPVSQPSSPQPSPQPSGQTPTVRVTSPTTIPTPTNTIVPPSPQPSGQPTDSQGIPLGLPAPTGTIAPSPQINSGGQTPNSKEPLSPSKSGGQLPELKPPDGLPPTVEQAGKLSSFVTQTTSTGTWRIGAVSSPFVRMAIAVNLQTIDREMGAIRNVFFLTIPLTLLLVMLGAWWMSGGALKPIEKITGTIRRITAKGLSQRLPIAGTDEELVELLQVFNQMLERLERSFTQASRFSADAAHELKTPLAILQGELERTLQEADAGSEFQQRLSNLLDEVRRLNSITRKLLLLSLADAGRMSVHKIAIDLSQVLSEMAEDLEMLAPDLEIHVQIEAGLQVQGDRELLTQVLQNLMGNAIKYNLPEGWLRIKSGRDGNFVFITIANRSKDIPESDRAKIFDRFHRGDAARTRHVEGFGLGLSLSQEIARAHGGDLKLDRTPAGHTAFTLTIPAAKHY
ncbi:ATP-binding protein [Tumidithrix helvetica PCC 7403]|uniref:sensor histidine kinase n=1 Tax=Tumidithrix helvetica TaxID=3457545 RepID=UPI003CAFC527